MQLWELDAWVRPRGAEGIYQRVTFIIPATDYNDAMGAAAFKLFDMVRVQPDRWHVTLYPAKGRQP